MFRMLSLFVAAVLALPGPARAEGYLAQKPEKLPDLVLGLGEAGQGLRNKGCGRRR